MADLKDKLWALVRDPLEAAVRALCERGVDTSTTKAPRHVVFGDVMIELLATAYRSGVAHGATLVATDSSTAKELINDTLPAYDAAVEARKRACDGSDNREFLAVVEALRKLVHGTELHAIDVSVEAIKIMSALEHAKRSSIRGAA